MTPDGVRIDPLLDNLCAEFEFAVVHAAQWDMVNDAARSKWEFEDTLRQETLDDLRRYRQAGLLNSDQERRLSALEHFIIEHRDAIDRVRLPWMSTQMPATPS